MEKCPFQPQRTLHYFSRIRPVLKMQIPLKTKTKQSFKQMWPQRASIKGITWNFFKTAKMKFCSIMKKKSVYTSFYCRQNEIKLNFALIF